MATDQRQDLEIFSYPLGGWLWPGLLILGPLPVLGAIIAICASPISSGVVRAAIIGVGGLVSAGIVAAIHFTLPVRVEVGRDGVTLRYLAGMSARFRRDAIRWTHSPTFQTLRARVNDKGTLARTIGTFGLHLRWLGNSDRLIELVHAPREG